MKILIFLILTVLLQGTGTNHSKNQQSSSDPGEKILLMTAEAMGGLENLQKIKNFRVTTRSILWLTSTKVNLEVTETILLPDKTKQILKMEQGTRIQILNGKKGWKQIAGKTSPLSQVELKEMQRGLFRDTIHLFQSFVKKEVTIRYLGEERIGGKTFYILQIKNPTGDFFNLYIDAESLLIYKKTYQGSAEVQLARLEEIYSEYQTVDGIKIPFHVLVRARGAKFMESDVLEVHFNLPIKESFFLPE
ncbi:MAG: hypothetical protein D6813_06480 [Calditrichaeota bacterium]|nr:MAG: hypothetical protein D6813_06480 [Calditrichota bacterium]